ncbi:MAG: L,D-transpeptidase [Pseudolabrys sp.]
MTSSDETVLNRRTLLIALAAVVGACATQEQVWQPMPAAPPAAPPDARYGALRDHGQEIPAIDPEEIEPALLRSTLRYEKRHKPGSIVIEISERRLYLVEPNQQAVRYAVGVARERALNFRGSAVIGRKEEWPSWTPTASMIARIPRYREYEHGMPGGTNNPLGARALYLYRDGRDSEFRIHGTNEPQSIGTEVSSGCIRMLNHDVIHLYDRVSVGTPVIVNA